MRTPSPTTKLMAVDFGMVSWSIRAVPPRSPYLILTVVVSSGAELRKGLLGLFGVFGVVPS